MFSNFSLFGLSLKRKSEILIFSCFLIWKNIYRKWLVWSTSFLLMRSFVNSFCDFSCKPCFFVRWKTLIIIRFLINWLFFSDSLVCNTNSICNVSLPVVVSRNLSKSSHAVPVPHWELSSIINEVNRANCRLLYLFFFFYETILHTHKEHKEHKTLNKRLSSSS